MSIKATQKCDKCKKERDLKVNIGNTSIGGMHTIGGWRPFGENQKHLCPECIRQIEGELGV